MLSLLAIYIYTSGKIPNCCKASVTIKNYWSKMWTTRSAWQKSMTASHNTPEMILNCCAVVWVDFKFLQVHPNSWNPLISRAGDKILSKMKLNNTNNTLIAHWILYYLLLMESAESPETKVFRLTINVNTSIMTVNYYKFGQGFYTVRMTDHQAIQSNCFL